MRVAVQVFAFEEDPVSFTRVMDRYAESTIPSFVEGIEYHACVTPSGYGTADAAVSHPVFEYVETPSGKLTSRNHAHDMAVESGFDIIVSGDGDSPPLRGDYLTQLLAPFENPDVVGVNGCGVSPGPAGLVVNVFAAVEDIAMPHMCGRTSAFTADGWKATGPFDTSVNQTNVTTIRKEEEFDFYWKLNQLGHVDYAREATVLADTRRYRCYVQGTFWRDPKDSFCQRRGVDTFQPRK